MPKGIVCDHKYHYFYKITNLVNNKFYYGIRSCDCEPEEDPYMGSGIYLHNAYRKYGVDNFEKEILRLLPTRRDALDLERWIVTIDLVKDPMCYNLALGGGSARTAENPMKDLVIVINTVTNERLVVTNSEYKSNPNLKSVFSDEVLVYDVLEMRYKRVKKSEYADGKKDRYLIASVVKDDLVRLYDKANKCEIQVLANDPKVFNLQSYRRLSMPRDRGYVVMNNGTEFKKVNPDEIDKYLSMGYVRGMINPSKSKGRIAINKDGDSRMINPDELNSYLDKGWKKGSGYIAHNIGTKEMHKGDDFRYVPLGEVQDYLNMGYEFGGLNHNSNKGFIFVTKDDIGDTKMINPDELDYYISLGYRKGTKRRPHTEGRKRINNGIHNKTVKPEELDDYLSKGYVEGFMKSKRRRKKVT